MSTLNPTTRKPRVRTHEGARARKASPEVELALRTFTTVFHDKFYEDINEQMEAMYKLSSQVRPEFLAKLSVVARNAFNMRTSPAFLLGVYTLLHGQPPMYTINRVFSRGDEIGDYLATVAALSDNGKVTPAAVRFARKVLQETMNERKVLRYARRGHKWNLAKAVLLSHARQGATPSQTALFNFVIKWNELGSQSEAWNSLNEDERSLLPLVEKAVHGTEDGSEISWERQRSSGVSWDELIPNMGYMALLRNLRNFTQDNTLTEGNWEEIVSRIEDPDAVRRSKQFPFRFLSAYRAVDERRTRLKRAISDALDISTEAIPEFPGRSLIVVDNSGSMIMPVSERSDMRLIDIANLFGAAMKRQDPTADVVHFATKAELYTAKTEGLNTMTIFKRFLNVRSLGYGTNLDVALRLVDVHNYDNIFIFSDMQIHHNVKEVTKNYKGNVFSINLDAYTPLLDMSGNMIEVSGWSDKTLELLSVLSTKNLVSWIMEQE